MHRVLLYWSYFSRVMNMIYCKFNSKTHTVMTILEMGYIVSGIAGDWIEAYMV